MNVALDTNAYSDFMRGVPSRVQVVRAARHLHLPLMVLAELRAGFAAGNQSSANAANLQRFLGSARVSVLFPDEQTTHHYAQIYLQLRKEGVAIPTNDLWIAALAVQHRLVLCTSDAVDPYRSFLKSQKKQGMEVGFSKETQQLGTAGAIKNAEKHADAEFFVFNGDILSDLDLSAIDEVRQTWQFYRDRRPDAYQDLVRP